MALVTQGGRGLANSTRRCDTASSPAMSSGQPTNNRAAHSGTTVTQGSSSVVAAAGCPSCDLPPLVATSAHSRVTSADCQVDVRRWAMGCAAPPVDQRTPGWLLGLALAGSA